MRVWCMRNTLAYKVSMTFVHMEVNVSQSHFDFIESLSGSTLALMHGGKMIQCFPLTELNIIYLHNGVIAVFIPLLMNEIDTAHNIP